jgi:2-polyprenyl-3-methyl-5-hydroxy-6-metoxy-1,4-benzoquinol methylase
MHCGCGCVFNLHKADPFKVFTESYREQFEGLKYGKERYLHYVRCYVPLIEELLYGRKFLDVGYGPDFIIQEMRERGWVSTGVDLIKHPNGYIKGDFLQVSFEGEQFDLIFMCDFLQCVDDPLKALRRAYSLLSPQGILLVVTPNTDLIRDAKIQEWGHWDMEANRQFFSEAILLRLLGKLGGAGEEMKVLYKNNNNSNRFPSWNNIHIIAQKLSVE